VVGASAAPPATKSEEQEHDLALGSARALRRHHRTVRFDQQPSWRSGDRVRVENGRIVPR
jgi:hypothetical protein